MGEDGSVVRIGRAAFRKLSTAELDIGEIIMRAFILRRVAFISHGQGVLPSFSSMARHLGELGKLWTTL